MRKEAGINYDQLYQDLLKVTRRRGFDRDEAHDLASQAITNILEDMRKYPSKYRSSDHIRRAAFTAARNLTATYSNRQKMLGRRNVRIEDESRFVARGRNRSTEWEVVRKEEHSDMIQTLLKIPNAIARQALILISAGLSNNEAADELGQKRGTVNKAIHKARKNIKWE